MGIIYQATNMVTGKSYIGQTRKSLANRIVNHKYRCFKKQDKTIFYDALRSYGLVNFNWTVIVYCDNKELDYYERELIYCRNTIDRRYGYNEIPGGHCGGFHGKKHTEEWKIKSSKRQIGTKRSDETKMKLSLHKKTAEHKRRISETRKRLIKEGKLICKAPVMFGSSNPAFKKITIVNVNTGEELIGCFTDFKKLGYVTTMMYSGSTSRSGWKLKISV